MKGKWVKITRTTEVEYWLADGQTIDRPKINEIMNGGTYAAKSTYAVVKSDGKVMTEPFPGAPFTE